MKVTPLNDRIIVLLAKKEQVSDGGIVIPDSAKEKPNTGAVVAVGTGTFKDGEHFPPIVAVGDVVLFEDWAGKEYKDGDDTFRILREDELLGLVKED